MIFDAQNLFSNKQTVTTTAPSQNVVKVSENTGAGEPLYVSVHAVESFAGLTSLNVELQSSSFETGPFSTIAQTGAISLAELKTGKVVNLGTIPPRTGKFLRLNYAVAGTGTAGKITAGLVLDMQTNGRM